MERECLQYGFSEEQTDKLLHGQIIQYGIAANLLGRRYLGLELEDEFLTMSMARRMEIENEDIRNKYLARINGIIHNA